MTTSRKILSTSIASLLVVGGIAVAGTSVASAADAGTADAVTTAAATTTDAAADPASAAPAAADGAATAVVPRWDRSVTKTKRFGTLKISPSGPYSGGQTITMSYTGFPANSQIVATTCIAGIFHAGPQDCAAINGPGTAISAASAAGSGKVTLKVVEGTLGATAKPSYKCSNKSGQKCVFSLTDFSGNGPATIPVVYKTAASSSTPSKSTTKATTSKSSTSGSSSSAATTSSTSTTTTTSSGPTLAKTGSSTSETGLLGVLMVGLGAFVLWTTRRRDESALVSDQR